MERFRYRSGMVKSFSPSPLTAADLSQAIENAVSELAELGRSANAEVLFITCAADLNVALDSPPSEETHGDVSALTELLAFHLVPWFGVDHKLPSPTHVKKALKAVQIIFDRGFELDALEAKESDLSVDLLYEVRQRAEIVRGDNYPEQTAEHIIAIQGMFEELLATRLGIGPKWLVAILWAIYRRQFEQLELSIPAALDHAEALSNAWKPAKRKTGSKTTEADIDPTALKSKTQAYRYGYLERLVQIAPESLICSNLDINVNAPIIDAEWQALIKLIGLTEFDRSQITNAFEIKQKPLITFQNRRVFLTHLTHAFDVAWNQYEEELKKEPDVYQRYQIVRSKWLEEKSHKIFLSLFPKASVYRNLSYPDPEKPQATAELDIAVYYGPFVLLVEAKSKQFRLSSQRGDKGRLRTDIKRNAEDSFEQARRAARYIRDSDLPEFIEIESGNKLKIDKSTVKRIYCLSISLKYLGGLANRLADTRSLGLFKNNELPFCISVADLEVISEFCPFPEMLLHYIERSLNAQQEPGIAADELDFFGAYLESRLLPHTKLMRVAKSSEITSVTGWASKFDHYREYKRGEGSLPEEVPSLRIPGEILQLIAAIRRRGDSDSAWITFSLLEISSKGLLSLAQRLKEIRSAYINPGNLQHFVIDDPDVVVCVSRALAIPADSFQEELREKVALEMYRRKISRGLGFGISVDQRTERVECYSFQEREWIRDEQMEEAMLPNASFQSDSVAGKLSRNSPCLCGSGKRFRDCCRPRSR